MEKRSFMRVDEVAAELGVSKSYAYKIVQRLNAELKAKGYSILPDNIKRPGINRRFCEEP